jgi:hypothetical protein
MRLCNQHRLYEYCDCRHVYFYCPLYSPNVRRYKSDRWITPIRDFAATGMRPTQNNAQNRSRMSRRGGYVREIQYTCCVVLDEEGYCGTVEYT